MTTPLIIPSVETLYQHPRTPYVDVDGLLDESLDLIEPVEDESIPPANILYNSPHGLGKSLLVAHLSVELGKRLGCKVPLIVFDCHQDTREYHLRGTGQITGEGSEFVPGPIPLAIEMATQHKVAMVCFEEINSLTSGAQKMLNGLTDWREGIYIPQIGRMFRVPAGCLLVVVATMNPSSYGGVYSLNQDLKSRFNEKVLSWPSKDNEKKILAAVCGYAAKADIERAAQLALNLRGKATEYQLSTRDLVQLLQNIKRFILKGRPNAHELALTMLANKYEGGERNTAIEMIKDVFSTSVKPFA